mmetsp:Transcript_61409/g.102202  ORF Transcript_61409/g.102202 Transcript_61409/m.102202 type:complete len:266 (+) Transcript_61409:1076-1873(+)
MVLLLQPPQLLLEPVHLTALLVAKNCLLHLIAPLGEEVQVCLLFRQVLDGQAAMLLLQFQERLLHRWVDRVKPPCHLNVVRMKLLLNVPTLCLNSHALVEDIIHTVSFLRICIAKLLRLLHDIMRLLVNARAVQHKVVVSKFSLQRAHLVGQALVLAFELTVCSIVFLALVNIALQRSCLLHDLRAFRPKKLQVVRVILDLTGWTQASSLHTTEPLLRHWTVRNIHGSAHTHARHVDWSCTSCSLARTQCITCTSARPHASPWPS